MNLRSGAAGLVAAILSLLSSLLLLLLSACGDGSGDNPDGVAQTPTTASSPTTATEPAAVVTTTSTTTTAPPATTAPATTAPTTTTTTVPTTTTTAAPERHEEAPLLFDLVVADADWEAEPGSDPLRATIRSGPGYSYEQVQMTTVPRPVMEGTGAVRSDEQGGVWRELSLAFGRTGWIEADRLEINLAAQTSYFDHPCATQGASQGPAPISGLTGGDDGGTNGGTNGGGDEGGGNDGDGGDEGSADHVAQVWHLIGPGCDRLHVAFGTQWDYDSGPPAAVVPDDVTVEAFGTWARVSVAGIEAARNDAAEEDTWNLRSVVAHGADRTVFIDVYAPGPSLFAAHVLSDPARLLVDVIPAPGSDEGQATTEVLRLHPGHTAFVTWPGALDDPREVALPLNVRGYSRWFEAGGVIRLHRADGPLATATVSGSQVVNPGTGHRWGLSATGWMAAWGTFEFTIDDIEPGEYRLMVGEYPPIDDSDFVGVTLPIRVSGP